MAVCNILNIANKDNMNPIDAWYYADINIQQFFKNFYEREIKNEVFDSQLKNDLIEMFTKGNVTDKTMVLTVLAAAEKFGA